MKYETITLAIAQYGNDPDWTAIIDFLDAILPIITLIVFFVMASNLSKIKKSLKPRQEDLTLEYQKLIAFGRKEEAKKILQDLIWFVYQDKVSTISSGSTYREDMLNDVKEEFSKRMKEVGLEWPEKLE